jgi:hypothetical protein
MTLDSSQAWLLTVEVPSSEQAKTRALCSFSLAVATCFPAPSSNTETRVGAASSRYVRLTQQVEPFFLAVWVGVVTPELESTLVISAYHPRCRACGAAPSCTYVKLHGDEVLRFMGK